MQSQITPKEIESKVSSRGSERLRSGTERERERGDAVPGRDVRRGGAKSMLIN
jgi:hypothetical protein